MDFYLAQFPLKFWSATGTPAVGLKVGGEPILLTWESGLVNGFGQFGSYRPHETFLGT